MKNNDVKTKYPKYFNSMYGSWCIDFDDGWAEILMECCDKLSATSAEIKFSTAKEKFGTMRLYTMGATEEQWNIIWDCEKKSAITCERCGKPGKINKSTGWMKTLCPDCGKEWEDNHTARLNKVYEDLKK